MKAINSKRGTTLAEQISVADNFWSRLRGLLGRRELPAGEGLYLVPCKCIHTFGMRFPIDALYLDDSLRIVHIEEKMEPNKQGPWFKNVSSVLELPAGTVGLTKTKINDTVKIGG